MDDDRGWSPDTQATFCATLVDEWARCGLLDAVVCPGSRSTPLALALAADERIRIHVHHDERSGSFMALGLAAAAGRPVVVVTTSGTAVVQLHAAVVEADLAGVPLLVCTADRPPELRDVAAPQTVDQTHLFGRSVRSFTDPGVPDASTSGTWRSMAARCWAEATGPWPGPVHLNLPFREPLVGQVGTLPPPRGDGPWHRRLRAARAAPVLEASLAGARGVVIAGRGTSDPDAVVALADALGWPLLADPTSGCRGSSSIAAFDPLLRTAFADRVRPEVVIRSGGMPASKVLVQWLETVAAEELLIAAPGWWPDPSRSAAVLLDAVPVAPEGHQPVREWLQAWAEAERLAATAIEGVLATEPLSEPAVARHLTQTLPPGALLVTSSSMPVRDVEWFGEGRRDVRIIANRGANGIDGVVSTAVGAALTGAKTVLLIGDVAFLHDSNGLLGLAQRGVDLTIVVLDNDGGGIFSFLPQRQALAHERFEQLFGTPHGLDLVALAQAFGVDAARIGSADELAWRPGVRVAVVSTDRDRNVELHGRLDAAVRQALAPRPGSSAAGTPLTT